MCTEPKWLKFYFLVLEKNIFNHLTLTDEIVQHITEALAFHTLTERGLEFKLLPLVDTHVNKEVTAAHKTRKGIIPALDTSANTKKQQEKHREKSNKVKGG